MAAAPLSKSPVASPARATAELHGSDTTPMATASASRPNALSKTCFDLHICLNLLPVRGHRQEAGLTKAIPTWQQRRVAGGARSFFYSGSL
jgi:hypothetical protein